MTTRIATSTAYDNAVAQLSNRQAQLTRQQEELSAGLKVLRPSDDPTAAAQAERASTREARITTDERALQVQKNAVSTAESTLGDAVTALQSFRTLVVQAGNTTLSSSDRATIATQLTTLRNQILGYANTQDSNGQPLFGGLGSTSTPFVDNGTGVSFNGLAGQPGSSSVAVPQVLDGYATFMNVPTGNGTFTISQAAGTTGVSSDAGQVTDPTAVTGHSYQVQFAVSSATPPATTYSVVDTTTGTTLQSAQNYTSGQSISLDGMSLTPSGTPANGDALNVAPSTRTSLFNVLDQAIAGVANSTTSSAVAQSVAQSLSQIDAGLARVSASRGRAGDLLNQVDDITSRQDTLSEQLETVRSNAQDLDMVKGLSDFQTSQTAYSAALGSYAQIQKLSLFNYIS